MATLSLNENNPPNNTETNNNSMISDKLIFENATSLSSESSQQNKNIETKDDDGIFSNAQSISEPSTLEKLDYGFDKTTQILGNVYRIGKAKVQDIFDEEKSFKDYI